MDVMWPLPQSTTTDHLLPKYNESLHYDRDYMEIEWNTYAIKSEPFLVNLKKEHIIYMV
jgi:hypothetical protein